MGGLVVEGGNFDWEKPADRFPLLNQADPSYHGAVWTQAVKPLGPIAYILKMRVTLLRDLGPPMSPFNAFLFIHALATFPLRIPAHSATPMPVTKFLTPPPQLPPPTHPTPITPQPKHPPTPYLHAAHP